MEKYPTKIAGRGGGGGKQVQGAEVHGTLYELVWRAEGEDEDEQANSCADHGNLHGVFNCGAASCRRMESGKSREAVCIILVRRHNVQDCDGGRRSDQRIILLCSCLLGKGEVRRKMRAGKRAL